jgi:hypothetical protein
VQVRADRRQLIEGDDDDSWHACDVYSSRADELRAFLRDKLGLSGIDIGGGWLIFNAPEAHLGVHPTEGNEPASGTADISFYCEDIETTMH